ncbi:nuclear inhibitor of protein phosphatase 1-like [Branchiostoma lanceolatum]|uniref:nuclear inhibitor of protein phosphatase 1-like n=1 Tax=Branchiostoma lanceolatum TaxID=7740 RepID=UPI0034537843
MASKEGQKREKQQSRVVVEPDPLLPPPFDVPSWAGKPPAGLHLDVIKGDKMIEKLIIDEKKYYLFGRNSKMCDFCIDHQSCSRCHAALVWHKHLNRAFLIDLNSTHGTHIGNIRLEASKPQQVPLDSVLRFGASTRTYVLREKPQTVTTVKSDDTETVGEEEISTGLLGLPEEETELDNLTEFNTAHNKRITVYSVDEPNLEVTPSPIKRKRKSMQSVRFMDDDEVINPEDVDPSVGRFRNLVSTEVIPVKKRKAEDIPTSPDSMAKRMQQFYTPGLYSDLTSSGEAHTPTSPTVGMIGSSVFSGFRPNLAPEVDLTPVPELPATHPATAISNEVSSSEPKKKKYAKEAWPGKKPTPSLLV